LCVAVPLQIKELKGKRAVLESLGVITEADISLITDPKPGEYILVHAGIAISKVEAAEAEVTLALFRELAEAEADG
jgi:hydrogenase expression/formation protein HypC